MQKRITWLLGTTLPLALLLYWLIGSHPTIRIEDARLAAPLIEVRSEASGTLASLKKEEGSWVEKGEVLFCLSTAEEEKSLAELQSKIHFLHQKLSNHLTEAEAAMQEYLNARSDEASGLQDYSDQPLARLGTQQGLAEECRNEISFTEQKIEIAKSAMEKKNFAAPTSGYLLERKKDDGEQVLLNDPVCLLCNAKELWIEATLPESSASKIRLGQKAIAMLPSDASLKWEGEISWISPIALPNHKGIPVRISLKEGYPDCLKPNLQVQLKLKVP